MTTQKDQPQKKVQPLIDGDILLYEIGFCGEFKHEDTGELVYRGFDFVKELLDDRIKFICEEVGATEAPVLYLTGTEKLNTILNKTREPVEFKPNFRYAVATVKPYKDRPSKKPFHFENLLHYMLSAYNVKVSNGMEADDLLAIDQGKDTIICTRDKDLRMVPGWHYGWECGKQGSFGPMWIDSIGFLEEKDNGKVIGGGLKFFFYQMIVGDVVDNIPGLEGKGKAFALKLFDSFKEEEGITAYDFGVKKAYVDRYGDEEGMVRFYEQAALLWMVQELNEDGSPVLYMEE